MPSSIYCDFKAKNILHIGKLVAKTHQADPELLRCVCEAAVNKGWK